MNIISFLSYCVIVTFAPGPTNIMISATVQNSGITKALKFAFGATIAFGVLLSISATLNTAIIRILPKLLPIMQIVGSIYILYLTYKIFRMDTSSKKHSSSQITGSYFLTGFFMQFVNPKVIMFTMTVIPSYVMPYCTSTSLLMVFVVGITFIGFLAFAT